MMMWQRDLIDFSHVAKNRPFLTVSTLFDAQSEYQLIGPLLTNGLATVLKFAGLF